MWKQRVCCWCNTSITHIPCESVSACGRRREGAHWNREGREERMHFDLLMWFHFVFFFFFYKAVAWLQVCSLRLLATFSKPTHSSLFFWLCVIQQHTFLYTFFFFFFTPLLWRVSGVPALVPCSAVESDLWRGRLLFWAVKEKMNWRYKQQRLLVLWSEWVYFCPHREVRRGGERTWRRRATDWRRRLSGLHLSPVGRSRR